MEKYKFQCLVEKPCRYCLESNTSIVYELSLRKIKAMKKCEHIQLQTVVLMLHSTNWFLHFISTYKNRRCQYTILDSWNETTRLFYLLFQTLKVQFESLLPTGSIKYGEKKKTVFFLYSSISSNSTGKKKKKMCIWFHLNNQTSITSKVSYNYNSIQFCHWFAFVHTS